MVDPRTKPENNPANIVIEAEFRQGCIDGKYDNQADFTRKINEKYNTNFNENTMRAWLSFRSKPDTKWYNDICKAFGCTIDYLEGRVKDINEEEAENKRLELQEELYHLEHKYYLIEQEIKEKKAKYEELQQETAKSEFSRKFISSIDSIVDDILVEPEKLIIKDYPYYGYAIQEYFDIIKEILSDKDLQNSLIFETKHIVDYFTNENMYKRFNDCLNNGSLPFEYPTKISIYEIAHQKICKCIIEAFDKFVKEKLNNIDMNKIEMDMNTKKQIEKELQEYLGNTNKHTS